MSLELAEFSVSTSECQCVETYRPFMSLELAEFSVSTSECQRVASGKGSQFVGRIIGEERGSRETWIRCVVNCQFYPRMVGIKTLSTPSP